METIRAIIVDDEPLARSVIHSYLDHHPHIKIVADCENGLDGLNVIHQKNPDLVFLDVQMPELNGFELVRHLEAKNFPAIIFTTAYDKYAIKAFDVNAVDYLLKPFNRKRFEQALAKALLFLEQKQQHRMNEKFSKLLEDYDELKQKTPLPASSYTSRILIKEQQKLFFIRTDHIAWIEAAGDYVQIHTDEKKYLVNDTLNHFEQKLNPAHFIRIHRSHMVNIDFIRELQPYFNGEYTVSLKNNIQLKLSRSYKENLQKLLKEFS